MRPVTIQTQKQFFASTKAKVDEHRPGNRVAPSVPESFDSVSRALFNSWLPELSAALGRTEEDLAANGLSPSPGFFSLDGVRVRFEDGSEMRFRYAFALRCRANPNVVGLFTEHAGNYEVELFPEDKLEGPGVLPGVDGQGQDCNGQNE